MVQFAESEHNKTMREYEQGCALSEQRRAGLSDRQLGWLKIEDELVAGGKAAVDKYETETTKMKKQASCLGEWGGIGIREDILDKAKARLEPA